MTLLVQPPSRSAYFRADTDLQCREYWQSINAICLGLLSPTLINETPALRCNQCAHWMYYLQTDITHLNQISQLSISLMSDDVAKHEHEQKPEDVYKPKTKLQEVVRTLSEVRPAFPDSSLAATVSSRPKLSIVQP